MGLTLRIALGITLGLTAAFIIRLFIISYMAEQAVEQINAQTKHHLEQINQRQREAEQRKLAEAQREQERKIAKHNRAAEQLAFDKVWNKFYVTPKGCEVYTSDKVMVDCTKHKKKAKEAFKIEYYKNKNSPRINESKSTP
jgi:mannitol-specific phosphotransferase system IIBC component